MINPTSGGIQIPLVGRGGAHRAADLNMRYRAPNKFFFILNIEGQYHQYRQRMRSSMKMMLWTFLKLNQKMNRYV